MAVSIEPLVPRPGCAGPSTSRHRLGDDSEGLVIFLSPASGQPHRSWRVGGTYGSDSLLRKAGVHARRDVAGRDRGRGGNNQCLLDDGDAESMERLCRFSKPTLAEYVL